MELQFQNTPLRCLRCSASGNADAEQTLELRIGEDMPPVGRVLGAWGQPLIRGKEWRGDQVRVNGGIMARALYEGESGGIYALEGWMPFQLRWDLKDSHSDGKMILSCAIRTMDVRKIGAEKLLLRGTVSANLRAMEREEYSVNTPQNLPEDIMVKMDPWPVCLPVEAGETGLSMEDEIILPPGKTEVERILFYSLTPTINDKKVMADKLVFRGTAELRMVYMGADGRLHEYHTELPISQYSELAHEYGPEARVWVEPMVADLELERLEVGRVRLKAELMGQYVIWDCMEVCVARDAYSLKRDVRPVFQQVRLPSLQDVQMEALPLHQTVEERADSVVSAMVLCGQPRMQGGEACVEGMSQILYYDGENRAQCVTTPFTESVSVPDSCEVGLLATGFAEAVPGGESMTLQSDMALWIMQMQKDDMSMVSGLTVGEERKVDPDRPSLILRRAGGMSLWELAKKYCTTEEKIRQANDLTDEPECGRMLLIPVE